MNADKLKAYHRAIAASRRAQEKVAALRAELAVDCTHPGEFVEAYRWEHDNGYGRQSWHTGKICTICRATDLYLTGSFRKPEPVRMSSMGE